MHAPFEAPVKVEMRERALIAIDQASHSRVEPPQKIAVQAPGIAAGVALKGDLQSLDADGDRYCYYLRPNPGDVLPTWLSSFARAARGLAGVKFYVVVDEATAPFELACRAAGSGLLRLTDDATFETLINYDDVLPAEVEAEFEARVTAVRRQMEQALDLNLEDLRQRRSNILNLVRGMSTDVTEKYVDGVERQFAAWSTWGEDLSGRLDAVRISLDATELSSIEIAVASGPVLDEDVDPT